jgi:hypothetical protein
MEKKEKFWEDIKDSKPKKVSKKVTPKVKEIIKDTKIEVEEVKENIKYTPIIKSIKEIYEEYIKDGLPYKIYLRGQIIFDSVNHKDKPLFEEDYFILFGKKYIYKGIRLEKY